MTLLAYPICAAAVTMSGRMAGELSGWEKSGSCGNASSVHKVTTLRLESRVDRE